jgi:hypothetical protein
MKILLTENKMQRLAVTWLNDRVGPLTGHEVGNLPGYYHFRYEGLDGSMPIFDYDTRNDKNIVYFKDRVLVSLLQGYFPLNEEESKEVIQKWLEEFHNLDINRMDFNQFVKPKGIFHRYSS